MPAGIKQSEYADLLRADLGATDARLLAAAGTLGERALGWPPSGGGWTVGQILEHLIIAADSYLTPMRRLIEEALTETAAGTDPIWRPSLLGGFLAGSLRAPRKLLAPRSYVPALTARPGVFEEFRTRQRQAAMLLERARPLEWTRIRMASPISRLIRLNLGDGFTIVVTHARRHLGQIERIRAQPGFPAIA